MAQGGILGVHTRVAYSVLSSPLTYVKLNQLLNVNIPSLDPDKVDVSRHGSIWKRNMPGMVTVGDMEVTLLQDLDPATTPEQAALFALQAAGTTLSWRVEVPNQRGTPTTWTPYTFGGWIMSFKPGTTLAEAQKLVLTVAFDDTAFTMGAAASSVIG